MIYPLKKPFQLNGSAVEEINLDLDSIDGDMLKSCENAFRALYNNPLVASLYLDVRYQEIVIGRISGINPQDLGKLKGPDFVGICLALQNFLLV